MKSYTDLEQSKKLAEILPLESADYYHAPDADCVVTVPYITKSDTETLIPAYKGAIPCWSLASLINVLECGALFKTPQGWVCQAYIVSRTEITNYYDNPIDACYEMIIHLHELNLL